MARRKLNTQPSIFPISDKPHFSPTDEQRVIARAFSAGKPLCINAFAGSGKTSTLRYLSLSSDKKGIFWAFNRRNADDAKKVFSSRTQCSTTHSMAYSAMGISRTHRHKMGKQWPMWKVCKEFHIEAWKVRDDMGQWQVVFSSRRVAAEALDSLRRWMHSDSSESDLWRYCYPSGRRVPTFQSKLHTAMGQSPSETVYKRLHSELCKDLLALAKRFWAAMWNTAHDMPMDHDAYLKAWQLSEPTIQADYLMLDEAQDTNPCVLDIFLKQTHCQQVVVGDRYQSLYSWRGAINAMDKFEGDLHYLTQSFRFGNAIASVANDILRRVGCRKELRGTPSIQSSIGEVVEGRYAYLTRTNAACLSEAFSALNSGKTIFMVGGTAEPISMLRSIYGILNNERSLISHIEIAEYLECDNPALELRKEADFNAELDRYLDLIDQYNRMILGYCAAIEQNATAEKDADVILSTVHKAKGTEYPQVVMGDDYSQRLRDDESQKLIYVASEDLNEEIHNLYVNATRAITRLEPNSLLI